MKSLKLRVGSTISATHEAATSGSAISWTMLTTFTLVLVPTACPEPFVPAMTFVSLCWSYGNAASSWVIIAVTV